MAQTVYCRDCGSEIRAKAEICPECGIRQKDPDSGSSSGNNPGVAAVCSFVVPGLGQVYNGELWKGILSGAITILFALTGIGLIIAIPMWIWLVFDAYKTAEQGPNYDDPDAPQDHLPENHRLPADKCRKIRKMAQRGQSHEEIANEMMIEKEAVSVHLNGECGHDGAS
jgi:TM2 domain-containing membrane protein YozV